MKLNKEQEEAVNHIEGPMLVIAGAGSGKTKVVTHRVAKLIQEGVSPQDILCVTFTNKAAEEMSNRINHMSNSRVLTCTFHSLGARILRESINEIGYRQDFTIFDDEDSKNLLKTCLTELEEKIEKGIIRGLKSKISSAKNDLLLPEDVQSNSKSDDDKLFCKVYPMYQTKLKNSNALDFDDLLFLCVRLLKENDEVRRIFQNRWLFVLIDEYQDTNYAQYSLSKMLIDTHQNIFVVGDPDQSIYSWRGARYQNILNFDKDFENAKTIVLEHNYRSTNNILSASNALVEHNTSRHDKKLYSTLGDGEKVNLFFAENEEDEAHLAVEKMLKHISKENIKLDEIAIFYRTNAQSRIFEEELIYKKLPYIIYGGLSFYQRREIKDILSFLKIVHNPYDIISFTRTINLPKRGLGKKAIEKLNAISTKYLISILDAARKVINEKDILKEFSFSKKQIQGLQEYLQLIGSLKDLAIKKVPIQELVKEVFDKSLYLLTLNEDKETLEDRKANIDSLIAKASDWDDKNTEGGLLQFLEDLTLITNVQEKKDQPSIKLMSIHNSKGLEFELVFLTGLEEDIFPHINSKATQEELEEERRLCYVGMTRAKKHLYISHANARYLWGFQKPMRASRFIKEIPTKYIKRSNSFDEFYTNNVDEIDVAETTPSNEYEFRVNDCVLHKAFGKGIVKKPFKTSLGVTYDVYFYESKTTKSLVAKYAKLKRY
jgi:DNA helicase II / ATP-dependent DNA helicase PcrA